MPTSRQVARMRVLMRPLRTIVVASIDRSSVMRRPRTMRGSMPSERCISSSCGPPPCTSTTRMPRWCRSAICSTSERVPARSPKIAPPALMTKTLPLYRRMYGAAPRSAAITADWSIRWVTIPANSLVLGPARRRRGEPFGFVETQQPVHPLQRAARGALHEVVDDRHHGDRPPVARRREMGIVARDHVLDAGRVVLHAHERPSGIEVAQCRDRRVRVEGFREPRLDGGVDPSRERPGMRNESDLPVPAARRAGERIDLRAMTVREGV